MTLVSKGPGAIFGCSIKGAKMSSTHYTFRRGSPGAGDETVADLLNRITAGMSNEGATEAGSVDGACHG